MSKPNAGQDLVSPFKDSGITAEHKKIVDQIIPNNPEDVGVMNLSHAYNTAATHPDLVDSDGKNILDRVPAVEQVPGTEPPKYAATARVGKSKRKTKPFNKKKDAKHAARKECIKHIQSNSKPVCSICCCSPSDYNYNSMSPNSLCPSGCNIRIFVDGFCKDASCSKGTTFKDALKNVKQSSANKAPKIAKASPRQIPQRINGGNAFRAKGNNNNGNKKNATNVANNSNAEKKNQSVWDPLTKAKRTVKPETMPKKSWGDAASQTSLWEEPKLEPIAEKTKPLYPKLLSGSGSGAVNVKALTAVTIIAMCLTPVQAFCGDERVRIQGLVSDLDECKVKNGENTRHIEYLKDTIADLIKDLSPTKANEVQMSILRELGRHVPNENTNMMHPCLGVGFGMGLPGLFLIAFLAYNYYKLATFNRRVWGQARPPIELTRANTFKARQRRLGDTIAGQLRRYYENADDLPAYARPVEIDQIPQ